MKLFEKREEVVCEGCVHFAEGLVYSADHYRTGKRRCTAPENAKGYNAYYLNRKNKCKWHKPGTPRTFYLDGEITDKIDEKKQEKLRKGYSGEWDCQIKDAERRKAEGRAVPFL